MTTPNFLLIGPPKCGTTALYATLAQHPQVFMSRLKEPFFFTFEGQPPAFAGPGAWPFQRYAVTQWEDYLALFADAGDCVAVGEASALYLTHYHPARTAEQIRRRLPDVRLVALLRQPAERAYSHFTYNRQRGLEPISDFRQALAAEERRIAANWAPSCRYRRDGWYYQNLLPYYERFPCTQIRVYLYDDWNAHPQMLLADLCDFLQVDPALLPAQVKRINVTTWSRSRLVTFLQRQPRAFKAHFPRWLRRWISPRLRAWNRAKPPLLAPALRRELTESYREEIGNLQALLGRDLAHWLAEPAAARSGPP